MPITYQVYVGPHGGTLSPTGGTLVGTTATVTSLAQSTTYDFQIVANNGATTVYSTILPVQTLIGETADATSIKVVGGTGTGTITDATGTVWSVSGSMIYYTPSGGSLTTAGNTSNVVELYYHNHIVYQMNTQYLWWDWVAAAWASVTDPRGGTTSAAQTAITLGSGTIIDNNLVHWSISAGNVIQVDDLTNNTITGVTNGYFNNGSVYMKNATSWYVWTASSSSFVATSDPTVTFVQVTVGVHVALELNNEPAGAYANAITHYNGFNTNMGRRATVLATVLGGNDVFSYQPGSAPNTWGNGDTGLWTNQGFPTDGSLAPMLHWHFSDGSTNTAYSIYSPANISTANFAGTGHTVAYYITNQLTAWKNLGIKKMYTRLNWEWNINGPGTQDYVPSGSTAAWLDAWRGWSNVVHDWGNANGVSVNTVWCPSVFNSSDDQGQAIRAYFPVPDANAHAGSDGVSKRYIDIIGPDFYGQFDPAYVPAGYNKTTNQVWCLRAMTDLCQDYGLNFADSECNDQLTTTQNAWQNWTPNVFVPWLNGLKNLSPPVKIEYVCLFDLNAGNAHEFSSPADNQPGNLAVFGQAFGGLGSSATYGTCAKVTTLA